MANYKTGAQRHNDRMDKIFAKAKVNNQKYSGYGSYEDEILSLIDDASEMTRSDLQGAVTAIVKRLVEEIKAN